MMRPNGSESRRELRRAERDAVFSTRFIDDLRTWVSTDRRTALRVFDLIAAVRRDAFQGMGEPEPLRHLGPKCGRGA
jgi:toxin YoeB